MKPWVRWLLVGVAVVVVAVASGPPAGGRALDPDGTGPTGARGLVEVLRRLGARVEVVEDLDSVGDGVMLVLDDRLDEAVRDRIRARVESGGVLVVADTGSPLSPTSPVAGLHRGGLTRDCDLAALVGAERVVTTVELQSVGAGQTGCYRGRDGAWLVVTPTGAGAVVSLGGAAPLLNANLDDADHAVVAAGLLAPDGHGTVIVVRPGGAGSGRRGLWSLVPGSVRTGLWVAVLAAAVWVASRARRLGRPVTDTRPVRVEGAALTMATARLHQRMGHHHQALAAVAEAARVDVGRGLGLGPDAPLDVVVEAAASMGIDASCLRVSDVGDDIESVVAAARSIARVRDRVLGGRR